MKSSINHYGMRFVVILSFVLGIQFSAMAQVRVPTKPVDPVKQASRPIDNTPPAKADSKNITKDEVKAAAAKPKNTPKQATRPTEGTPPAKADSKNITKDEVKAAASEPNNTPKQASRPTSDTPPAKAGSKNVTKDDVRAVSRPKPETKKSLRYSESNSIINVGGFDTHDADVIAIDENLIVVKSKFDLIHSEYIKNSEIIVGALGDLAKDISDVEYAVKSVVFDLKTYSEALSLVFAIAKPSIISPEVEKSESFQSNVKLVNGALQTCAKTGAFGTDHGIANAFLTLDIDKSSRLFLELSEQFFVSAQLESDLVKKDQYASLSNKFEVASIISSFLNGGNDGLNSFHGQKKSELYKAVFESLIDNY